MDGLESIKKQLTSFHLPCLQFHSSLHPFLPPSLSPLFPCLPGCCDSLVVAVAAAADCAAMRESNKALYYKERKKNNYPQIY